MTDPAPPPRPRVLVIDDDVLVRNCIDRCLRKVAELALASDVSEARGLLLERRFDVIVSDLSLPDGDGFALLVEASRSQPSAKLFVFSGYEPTAEVREAIEGGLLAGNFLKPEGLSELLAFVRQLAADAKHTGPSAGSGDKSSPRPSGIHPTQGGQAGVSPSESPPRASGTHPTPGGQAGANQNGVPPAARPKSASGR